MRRRLVLLLLAAAAAAPAPAAAVVGGSAASEPYPWMSALLQDDRFICGGSLVAADRVLTAAHCVVAEGRPLPAARFKVEPGATDVSRSPTGAAVAVAAVEVHPSYDPSRSDAYDVAVLRLAAPAGRGAPIALADPADRGLWPAGAQARVIGFGSEIPSDPGLTGGGPLKQADVPVVADRECRGAYGDAFDAATMLCAGERLGLKDACQGDSGGPLMVRRPAGAP
jgi:trypsin